MAGGNLQTAKQIVEYVGPFYQIAHQQEQRDGHQRIVVEHGKSILRQQVEHAAVEECLMRLKVGVEAKPYAQGHQGKRHRKADHDGGHQYAQHGQRNDGIAHELFPSVFGFLATSSRI